MGATRLGLPKWYVWFRLKILYRVLTSSQFVAVFSKWDGVGAYVYTAADSKTIIKFVGHLDIAAALETMTERANKILELP